MLERGGERIRSLQQRFPQVLALERGGGLR
jgi:hypothetical protein